MTKATRFISTSNADVPYLDHRWVLAAAHDGKPGLHVLIQHPPLDKRPAYTTDTGSSARSN
jgi:hypothetical protein